MPRMTTNEILTRRALEDGFDGRVLQPGDDGYDEARLPWQRRFDPRPAIIADATSARDVAAAVRTAREHDLSLAVQATGHGAVLPADGSLLLRTGALNGLEIDAGRKVARAGAGTQWGDVIAAAGPYGLAPLSGTSTTVGVAGYTLGGGMGWLSRAYGFAADSLISAEVVTADGEIVTAGADEHPDLFWALRGGGGNFGVVTALEFRLHDAPLVYAGTAMFDIERAREALAVYRDWALTEPDESTTALVVMTVPPLPQLPEEIRGRRVLALRAMYLGGADAARRAWAPLLDAGGAPLMDGMREMGFAETATALGPPPPPSVGEMRLELLREVPDAVLDAALEAEAPVAAVELRHWGGAMARPGADAGPCGHRDVPFSVVAGGMVEDRAQLGALGAALDGVLARVRAHATGGTFLNFLGEATRASDAYTPEDHARLTAVKRAYDPDNLLRINPNIPPA
jgi:FAD/FMN-containing dehydrogenase